MGYSKYKHYFYQCPYSKIKDFCIMEDGVEEVVLLHYMVKNHP